MNEKRFTIRVLITGGGSGGHIFPLLAVVEELKQLSAEKDFGLQVTYMGPASPYEKEFYEANIAIKRIFSGKIRRYLTPISIAQNAVDILKLLLSVLQALVKVFVLMPSVIFSKGGPGAFPVVFAGWFYRIPVIIHESDAVPGLTNRFSSRFATRIGISFARAGQFFSNDKTAWVGNPIRHSLIIKRPDQKTAKEALGFTAAQPLLVIIGGSQGAQRINEFIVVNLPALLAEAQVLHQTGKANIEEVKRLAHAELLSLPKEVVREHYKPVAFLSEEMPMALAAADLVVTRAGASSLFEIAAFGKPAIVIPLPESANGHQRANAYEFAKTGAAIVIESTNLFPGVFLNQLRMLLKSPPTLEKMGKASRAFFKPDAAHVIAEEIVGLALNA